MPSSLQELKDTIARAAFGMTKAEAHAKGICIDCKATPRIMSDAGKREYLISGLCEPCFDKVTFGEEMENGYGY
jgi:hypothetical protein